ncbi:MAG TPA: hypothetical protein ENH10_08105 [Bacteroidetes bacterium]|nr:hypothetical protein [Bacteroidota bacterium]HEX05100.1 hypothetical protein [Bacteroidota bacterium]
MNSESLFAVALGINPPWEVEGIEFSKDNKRLDIKIGFRRGATFPCPVCGTAAPVHETARSPEIYSKRNYYKRAIERLPEFYRMCYCDEVLKFLLSARKHLNWKNNSVDATLMSILLVYLHGKLEEAMSNQMSMTKAMGINYSVNWWKKRKLTKPPKINPLDFVMKKLDWRYEKGIPSVYNSRVILGDSTIELKNITQKAQETAPRFSLLFTSPPYCSLTDYHADQWLRLWLLGGQETPKSKQEKFKGRFVSKDDYCNLLDVIGNHIQLP